MFSKKIYLIVAAVISFFISVSMAKESSIWGLNGDKWDKTRIPVFTSAGYKNGIAPIPVYTIKVNVKDLGAKGDGISDDTRYFRQAIKQCPSNGAVLIPAGIYKITDTIQVGKSGCSICGESEANTIIYFTKGLEELYPLYNGSQTSWSWQGSMLLFKGNISDVGVQDLTIKFPDSVWAGHNFHERGYNGIGFDGISNGWMKNITITGADVGIWISRSTTHLTADHWTLNFGPIRGGATLNGHHGINCYGGYNLLSNFKIFGKFQHDLSVEGSYCHHNVFTHGWGKDICFDHHSTNYDQKNNLFTDIDIGQGSRMYASGGDLTPRGVSFSETWWNIRSANPVKWVTSMGISRNNVIVGIKTTDKSALPDQYNNWFEAITPDSIVPQNLYLAQMQLLVPLKVKREISFENKSAGTHFTIVKNSNVTITPESPIGSKLKLNIYDLKGRIVVPRIGDRR